MSDVQTAVPLDHPLMRAWEAYKRTPEFQNTKNWATDPNHVDGSLWAAFARGYYSAGSGDHGP